VAEDGRGNLACGGAAQKLRERYAHAAGLPGSGGLRVCTWVSFRLGQTSRSRISLSCLVVLAALYGGFWQATVISVAAAACLNYYLFHRYSASPTARQLGALGAFEFTALVISRLSQRVQLRAQEAVAGRRDMERLTKPRGGYCCWIVRASLAS